VQGGEAQITFDLRDLEDLLVDLKEMQEDISYWAEKSGMRDYTYTLEPRTQDLLDALEEAGVKW
jgi:hypothetical protein